MSFLLAASDADVGLLFVLLALCAFGIAVWQAVQGAIVPAIVAAFIGVVILVVA